MKMFIWALRELGVIQVPSFYALRKMQTKLRESQGVPCLECTSVQGNVFYINDVRTVIAHDWLNPHIRKNIHVYPEISTDGVVTEVWHAEKWRKEMDVDLLSPMYDSGLKYYYVHKLSCMKTGDFVILMRWIMVNGRVCADSYRVTFDEQKMACVVDSEAIQICTDDLEANFLDLLDEKNIPEKWSETTITAGYPSRMPNRYRAIANGDPLYVSFIDYFGDDVSGNRSKSWNKHNNSYITHRNLPRRLLHQEFHVHLISTSQHATISEQYHSVKKLIDATHETPIKVFDTTSRLTTQFMLQTHAGPSDNPAQSDVSSHIGSMGNHPCRKCEMGGPELSRAQGQGFHTVFMPGNPRTKEKIRSELEAQVKMACSGIACSTLQTRQKETGTKDAYMEYWIDNLTQRYNELQNGEANKSEDEAQQILFEWAEEHHDNIYNPFLSTNGFNPACDTPVEILHTILLGAVKYIWHYSNTKFMAHQKILFTQHFQATNCDGLSIPEIQAGYIMKYANSLNGGQFRQVIQTIVFHIHDIVPEEYLDVWKAASHLSALLWQIELDNIKQYCNDIQRAGANVQDSFAVIDATKMLQEFKLHLLGHLTEDTLRFGPLVGMATETFESFNSMFWSCSVLSNHRALSRDIALQMGNQESLKHRLFGGYWYDKDQSRWTKAGLGVQEIMSSHPILQGMLGWSPEVILPAGTVKKVPAGHKPNNTRENCKESCKVKLSDTYGGMALNFTSYDEASTWSKCRSVIAVSGDVCNVGSWVFYTSPVMEKAEIGRIKEILTDDEQSLAVLEEFTIAPTRDIFFSLPYVFRRHDEYSYVIVRTQNISFLQNLQHDCRTNGCDATGTRKRINERKETDQMQAFIEHKSDRHYLINLFSFHNAHLVRHVLPCELTVPVMMFPNRLEKHLEITKDLYSSLIMKKAETQKKRANTIQTKKRTLEVDTQAEGGGEGNLSIELEGESGVQANGLNNRKKRRKK
ncbi:hypothetical protein E1B28_006941 [Marasmius oreades]|uniref:Uncharacterized protein n=1 Tax=Marasmius oreades TaxID=181124 RepID=A0A9P7UT95_9AGAR|nr:uncharacterized protein E1B28_006941 [Marasmius oreades]KAG7093258.1 hypothetical protein E1B28_006941 [Marasmius oreades]